MKKHKILTIVLTVVLTLILLPAALAADDDFYIDEYGGLIRYIGSGGDVVIPDGVICIRDGAFEDCTGLTSVVIPDSVISIWQNAFKDCISLTGVTIPDSVTSIERGAFYGCTGLTSVTIGNGVSSIGDEAFEGCSGLTNVTIPDSVTSVGYNAFEGCTGLKSAGPIGGGCDYEFGWMETIPDNAFRNLTGLSSVTIPEGVTEIGSGAFWGCTGLTHVTLPSTLSVMDYSGWSDYGVFSGCTGLKTVGPVGGGYDIEFGWTQSIPSYAFLGCTSLTSVTIPDSVTGIGGSAFSGCTGLTRINIPEGVTSIEEYTFSGCTALTSLTIRGSGTEIKQGAFDDCPGLKTAGPVGGGYDFEFGWTTKIPNYAFSHCTALTSVVIPDGVTYIRENAFSGCVSLTHVTVSGSVHFGGGSDGKGGFADCAGIKTAGPIGGGYDYEFGWTETIPSYAFNKLTGLVSVTFPEDISSIEENAFYGCTSLESVDIPNSVTSIGGRAFEGCTGLTHVTVPSAVDIVVAGGYSGPFYGCTGLKTAGPIGGGYDYEFGWTETIPSYAFLGCTSLTSVTIPDSVTSIGNSAFSGCAELTDITIPESVTKIGSGAFSGCTGLTGIVLPEGVANIGSAVFLNCTGLTHVTLPSTLSVMDYSRWSDYGVFSGCTGLKTAGPVGGEYDVEFGWTQFIPSYAFFGCTSLTSVTIPEGMGRIGDHAFSGCTGLTHVTIPDTVTEFGSSYLWGCGVFDGCTGLKTAGPIGRGYNIEFGWRETIPFCAFKGCTGLTSVVIPEGVSYIQYEAFSGCSELAWVNIPTSVCLIDRDAFNGCAKLTNVTLPQGMVKLGSGAFQGCTKLTEVEIRAARMEIEATAFAKDGSPRLTIYGYPGSTAETYCADTRIRFSAMPQPGTPQEGVLTAKDGRSLEWSISDQGFLLVNGALTGALAEGEMVILVGYDESGRFTTSSIVTAHSQTPWAWVYARTPKAKFFWLDAAASPQAESVTVWGR